MAGQDESLVLPFAVYTAWRGYDWSSVPEDVTREELDRLYRDIGARRPDFMGDGDSFGGVYCKDGLLAAFRMQCVPKWDSVGRDADYCAFAFMGLDVVRDIDFDALLAMDEFVRPVRAPRNGVDYRGPASASFPVGEAMDLRDRREAAQVDFRAVGDLLASCGDFCRDWLFGRVRFRGEERVFAETGAWTGEPAAWKAERSRRNGKCQRMSFKDFEGLLGGRE